MKKFIAFLLAFCVCKSIFADEEKVTQKTQYGYLALGLGPLPVPIPQICGGFRYQNAFHGLDLNAQLVTTISATAVKFGIDYLYYPDPTAKKPFYFGIGPTVIEAIKKNNFSTYFAPEFIMGKQRVTVNGHNRHYQMNVMCPLICTERRRDPLSWIKKEKSILWCPVVTFSYGWGF